MLAGFCYNLDLLDFPSCDTGRLEGASLLLAFEYYCVGDWLEIGDLVLYSCVGSRLGAEIGAKDDAGEKLLPAFESESGGRDLTTFTL